MKKFKQLTITERMELYNATYRRNQVIYSSQDGETWTRETLKTILWDHELYYKVEPELVAFGKLSPKARTSLLEAYYLQGCTIECLQPGGWFTIEVQPNWIDDNIYRVKHQR